MRAGAALADHAAHLEYQLTAMIEQGLGRRGRSAMKGDGGLPEIGGGPAFWRFHDRYRLKSRFTRFS